MCTCLRVRVCMHVSLCMWGCTCVCFQLRPVSYWSWSASDGPLAPGSSGPVCRSRLLLPEAQGDFRGKGEGRGPEDATWYWF